MKTVLLGRTRMYTFRHYRAKFLGFCLLIYSAELRLMPDMMMAASCDTVQLQLHLPYWHLFFAAGLFLR